MWRACICLMILLSCSSTVQAAGQSVAGVLEANGYKLLVRLLKAVGAYEPAKKPCTVTLFAPTDEAILQFLKSMSLSEADIVARPKLVDALLGYHLVPMYRGTGSKLKPGQSVQGRTVDPRQTITITKGTNGQIFLKDMQGNQANAVDFALDAGPAVVHGIDRVLLSNRTFTTIDAALKSYKEWSSLRGAEQRANLPWLSNGNDNSSTEWTMFAPSNKAVRDAPGEFALHLTFLDELLAYHVLPGFKTIPNDFKQGVNYPTKLKNSTVSVRYSDARNITNRFGRSIEVFKATVVPEAGSVGRPAVVALPNIFAGRSVVHGITQVLLPKAGIIPIPDTPAEGRRRRLMDWDSDELLNRASAANMATASAIEYAAAGGTSAKAATAYGHATLSSVSSQPRW